MGKGGGGRNRRGRERNVRWLYRSGCVRRVLDGADVCTRKGGCCKLATTALSFPSEETGLGRRGGEGGTEYDVRSASSAATLPPLCPLYPLRPFYSLCSRCPPSLSLSLPLPGALSARCALSALALSALSALSALVLPLVVSSRLSPPSVALSTLASPSTASSRRPPAPWSRCPCPRPRTRCPGARCRGWPRRVPPPGCTRSGRAPSGWRASRWPWQWPC